MTYLQGRPVSGEKTRGLQGEEEMGGRHDTPRKPVNRSTWDTVQENRTPKKGEKRGLLAQNNWGKIGPTGAPGKIARRGGDTRDRGGGGGRIL